MRARNADRAGGGTPGAAGAAGGASETGQRLRKVTASADERTNAVVVSANPETMRAIEKVLKDLDSNPAEDQAVFIYRCRNAKAANLESMPHMLISGTTGSGKSVCVNAIMSCLLLNNTQDDRS